MLKPNYSFTLMKNINIYDPEILIKNPDDYERNLVTIKYFDDDLILLTFSLHILSSLTKYMSLYTTWPKHYTPMWLLNLKTIAIIMPLYQPPLFRENSLQDLGTWLQGFLSAWRVFATVIDWYDQACSWRSTSSQKCRMGLRPGLCAGQSNSSKQNSENYFCIDLVQDMMAL